MTRILLYVSFIISCILPIHYTYADLKIENSFIEIGQQTLQGETSYDIGVSLLEFPMADIKSNYIKTKVQIGKRFNVWFTGSQESNTKQNKKFIDSDFLIANDQSTLYIYSESDNDFKGSMFDLGLSYNVIIDTPWTCTIGAGIKKQNLSYTVYNVHQWNPNVEGSDIYVNDQTAMTYDANHTIPYAQFSIGRLFGPLSFSMDFEYSEYVRILAEDDHVLRNKLTTFDSTGTYAGFQANISYTIYKNWTLSTQYHMSETETFGTHTQTIYDGSIDNTVSELGTGYQITKSTHSIFQIGLQYKFI